mmetsp:Transcript_16377/g.41540  ORF Transcript_16377/g.41540 Transcript_16377/m.41540 type:complete len:264 (-) Transcript_16377:1350-2141(-)
MGRLKSSTMSSHWMNFSPGIKPSTAATMLFAPSLSSLLSLFRYADLLEFLLPLLSFLCFLSSFFFFCLSCPSSLLSAGCPPLRFRLLSFLLSPHSCSDALLFSSLRCHFFLSSSFFPPLLCKGLDGRWGWGGALAKFKRKQNKIKECASEDGGRKVGGRKAEVTPEGGHIQAEHTRVDQAVRGPPPQPRTPEEGEGDQGEPRFRAANRNSCRKPQGERAAATGEGGGERAGPASTRSAMAVRHCDEGYAEPHTRKGEVSPITR